MGETMKPGPRVANAGPRQARAIRTAPPVPPELRRVGGAFTLTGGRVTGPPVAKSEAPLPSIWGQARSLGRAVVATVAAVVTGRRAVVDAGEAERRHAICRTNACRKYRASDDRCASCGCYARAKLWLDAVRCPVGLW